jgi:hypothetical protein
MAYLWTKYTSEESQAIEESRFPWWSAEAIQEFKDQKDAEIAEHRKPENVSARREAFELEYVQQELNEQIEYLYARCIHPKFDGLNLPDPRDLKNIEDTNKMEQEYLRIIRASKKNIDTQHAA